MEALKRAEEREQLDPVEKRGRRHGCVYIETPRVC
jgi:hypothetical protein